MSRLWILGLVAAAVLAAPMLVSFAADGERGAGKGDRAWTGKGGDKAEGRPEGPPLTDEQKKALEVPVKDFVAAMEAFQKIATDTLGPRAGRMFVMQTIGKFMRESAPPRGEGEGAKPPRPDKGEGKRRGGEQ